MSDRFSRASRRDRRVRRHQEHGAARCACEPLEVRALLSAAISGVVFDDANANGTQDAAEAGLSGVSVNVTDSSGTTVGAATTDSSGSYNIAGLPANESLTVSAVVAGYILPDHYDGSTHTLTLSDGDSGTENFGEFRTLRGPTSLAATAVSGAETDLSWTSNSAGFETGFHVYEAVNGGAFGTTPVATTSTNVTSCAITGLDSANDYVFAVAAYDLNGDSALSNVADAAAPPAPAEVDTSALFDGTGVASLTVHWTPGAGAPAGTTYDVYVGANGALSATPTVTGLTGTSWTNGSVTPGGNYAIAVRAVAAAPLASGATPASGSVGGPQTGVPTQENSITYLQFASVMTYSIYTSAAVSNLNENDTYVTVPPFSSSLGTLRNEQIEVLYTQSYFLVDPNPPQGGGSSGAGGVSFDGSEVDVDLADGSNFGATCLSETGYLEIPQPSPIDMNIVTWIPWAGDGAVLEGAFASIFATTYTYTDNPPAVTTQPTNQAVAAGSIATFAVSASGSPTTRVQWRKSTDGGNTWADIPGATSSTYSFTPAPSDNGSQYEAVFTNAAGSVTTSPATLTVYVAPPALSGAPVINGDDPNGLYTASGQPTNGKQRSMVEDVVYTFNEPVLINDASSAFTVAVAGPAGGTVPSTLYAQAVAGTNDTQWAVSLTGQPEGTLASIANGEYSITINPSYVFAAADGVTSMAPGTGRTDTFYRLFADINGDEVVNTSDEFQFNKALNSYNPAFDYNGDGTINTADEFQASKSYSSGGYVGDGFTTTI